MFLQGEKGLIVGLQVKGTVLVVTASVNLVVVVQGHCTPQDNSGRIGRPKDENLKLEKERGREDSRQVYIDYC